MLHIMPQDRVLEIGSGNRPRKRSNVLCDRNVEDNTERAGGESLARDARPFVVADGHALPFKDKSFDYVIASHILEHVEDPRKFVAELMRVAKRGYIETPSELAEELSGWPFHRWKVRLEHGTLILRPRTTPSCFGNYFHERHQDDPLFAEFVDSHHEDFYVQLEWSGQIHLRVEDDDDPMVKQSIGMKPVSTRTHVDRVALAVIRSMVFALLRVARHFRKFR